MSFLDLYGYYFFDDWDIFLLIKLFEKTGGYKGPVANLHKELGVDNKKKEISRNRVNAILATTGFTPPEYTIILDYARKGKANLWSTESDLTTLPKSYSEFIKLIKDILRGKTDEVDTTEGKLIGYFNKVAKDGVSVSIEFVKLSSRKDDDGKPTGLASTGYFTIEIYQGSKQDEGEDSDEHIIKGGGRRRRRRSSGRKRRRSRRRSGSRKRRRSSGRKTRRSKRRSSSRKRRHRKGSCANKRKSRSCRNSKNCTWAKGSKGSRGHCRRSKNRH